MKKRDSNVGVELFKTGSAGLVEVAHHILGHPAAGGLFALALNQLAYKSGLYDPREISLGAKAWIPPVTHDVFHPDEWTRTFGDIGYWQWKPVTQSTQEITIGWVVSDYCGKLTGQYGCLWQWWPINYIYHEDPNNPTPGQGNFPLDHFLPEVLLSSVKVPMDVKLNLGQIAYTKALMIVGTPTEGTWVWTKTNKWWVLGETQKPTFDGTPDQIVWVKEYFDVLTTPAWTETVVDQQGYYTDDKVVMRITRDWGFSTEGGFHFDVGTPVTQWVSGDEAKKEKEIVASNLANGLALFIMAASTAYALSPKREQGLTGTAGGGSLSGVLGLLK